jgi:hypothetical protein
MDQTLVDYMQNGEIGYDPHLGAHHVDSNEPLLPNPFIISKHFQKALEGMERLIHTERQTDGKNIQECVTIGLLSSTRHQRGRPTCILSLRRGDS